MATRQDREEEAQRIIQPFVDDWLESTSSDWAAFRNFAVGQVLWDVGLTDEQIEEATSVDGANDMGIDAWWLAADEAGVTLYLVQSKNTRATRDDLRKLRDGFVAVMDPAKAYTANRPLQERAAELRERLVPHLTIEMHLISSRLVTASLRTDGQPLEEETVRIHDNDYPVSLYVHDVESLKQNLQVIDGQPILAQFGIRESDYFKLKPSGGLITVSAAIKGSELARLYNEHRINLFRENPRYYLGLNKINREMYATLKEDPVNFYLYNNGLTATCSSVADVSNGNEVSLEMRDFQIVNGCQTTVTIHEIWRRGELGDKLQEILVPIRIIETQNATTMAKLIAERTNRQTAMRSEDFLSGDKVHERLHGDFNRLSPRWYYELKRGTWNTDMRSAQARTPYLGGDFSPRMVKLKDLAQACLAFLGKPHMAGDRVREYFRSEELHRQLFPENVTAQQLVLPYVIFQRGSALVRQTDADAKTRGEPYEWSMQYLRFPLVACVAGILRYLQGFSGENYFAVPDSLRLVESLDTWEKRLLPKILGELVEYFDGQAKEGRAVRSLVRQDDWMATAFDKVKKAIDVQLEAEATAARDSGQEIGAVGLRSVLPIALPSPGG